MKKSLRLFACLVGGAMLLGAGCGGAPEETSAEPQQEPTAAPEGGVHQQAIYMVCWGTLGVYSAPSTSSYPGLPMSYGHRFQTDSSVFWANGEYWVRGGQYCEAPYYCSNYGYVRWAGLC